MWPLTFSIGLFLVTITHSMRTSEVHFTWFEATLYGGFSRIAWSLCLSWVVLACVKGYGGPINSFLSWGLFTVLSRLTYFTYLIHYDILILFYNSFTYTFEASNFVIVSQHTTSACGYAHKVCVIVFLFGGNQSFCHFWSLYACPGKTNLQ